jgi:GDPmannose 4,6-dehydratase
VTTLRRVVHDVRPDEVYHLAAQSSPQLSLAAPVSAMDCIGMSTLHLLEIVRDLRSAPRTLYASSAEIFGVPAVTPQNESTAINPVTPYGAAKAYGHHIARIYREAHRLPVTSVIFFNHESPRRDEMFVTRKITRAAGRIKAGVQGELVLGDLTARRDWGYAKDYVELMWRALQHDEPGEYVAATGEAHTVGEFVEASFGRLGLDWRQHVRHATPQLLRARDSRSLVGDARRAREVLGWTPRTRFDELVTIMTEADAKLALRETATHGADGMNNIR